MLLFSSVSQRLGQTTCPRRIIGLGGAHVQLSVHTATDIYTAWVWAQPGYGVFLFLVVVAFLPCQIGICYRYQIGLPGKQYKETRRQQQSDRMHAPHSTGSRLLFFLIGL